MWFSLIDSLDSVVLNLKVLSFIDTDVILVSLKEEVSLSMYTVCYLYDVCGV